MKHARFTGETEYGDRLALARTRAHLTQLELATAIGVRSESVSRWERGAGLPRYRTRQRLADLLNPKLTAGHSAVRLEAEIDE